MYAKSFYRTRFTEIKDIVKLTVIADQCGISKPYISQFLKHEIFDDLISLSDLEKMYKYLNDRLGF